MLNENNTRLFSCEAQLNKCTCCSVCLSVSKLNFSLFGQVMTTYAQLEETGKVDYWATGLLVMTFIDPYCTASQSLEIPQKWAPRVAIIKQQSIYVTGSLKPIWRGNWIRPIVQINAIILKQRKNGSHLQINILLMIYNAICINWNEC